MKNKWNIKWKLLNCKFNIIESMSWVFYFSYFFRNERKESVHITHLVFNVKRKQNNSRATRRCRARQKLMYAKKQIFKGRFKARGFFHMGSKEGTHPWCWIDNFFLFHLWFRVTKIVLWFFHVCGRSPMGLVSKKLQNSRCLFVSNNNV